MCYVTNLDYKTYACKLACPKTCSDITFTWLEHARTSTKSRHIIGAQNRGSYWDNVTVYPYNRYITGTNLHTTLKHLRAGTSNAVNKAVQAQLSCSVFICHWCRYQKVLESYWPGTGTDYDHHAYPRVASNSSIV